MRPMVLTVDIGTQSLRAVLVDTEGNLLNMVRDRFENPIFTSAELGRAARTSIGKGCARRAESCG